MTQYIDKDALVAEIKRRRKLVSDPILSGNDLMIGERNALFDLLSFINDLEVKEVDLEKEIEIEWNKSNPIDEGMGVESAYIHIEAFDMIARHFFELGLKVNQKGE